MYSNVESLVPEPEELKVYGNWAKSWGCSPIQEGPYQLGMDEYYMTSEGGQ